jgi:hypothetical protein
MNETHSHSTGPLDYARPGIGPRPSTTILVGGGMGIAGAFLGLIIFLAACFGFEGAFLFSPLPFLLGAIGLVVCIVGAVTGKGSIEDTQVLGVMFVCLFGIVGGLLEMSVRYGWHVLGA